MVSAPTEQEFLQLLDKMEKERQTAFNEGVEAAAAWHDEQAKRHRERGKISDIANAMSHDREAAAIRKLKGEIGC